MDSLPPVSDAQRAAVDKVARLVVRFGFAVPAIFLLESLHPLTFVGSQGMLVLSPMVGSLVPAADWDELQKLFEDRRGLEVVIRRIEELDREARQKP
jgi:hypothetical protein